ncbi:MAG TPA: cellulose biosynthesis cyclic di-GMP-binding regulatory protein BcsB [Burkholderiaceae bacterium]|nr:cellulose biosynthesis cyclic di-GMP-binding regulatory protein BcsB [Burkholderiaceae bacterium]
MNKSLRNILFLLAVALLGQSAWAQNNVAANPNKPAELNTPLQPAKPIQQELESDQEELGPNQQGIDLNQQVLDPSQQRLDAIQQDYSVEEIPMTAVDTTPRRGDSLSLSELTSVADLKLLGLHNSEWLEFTLRNDQMVERAELNLFFTPSPALLPKLSHLRVYLNDELMGVVPIESEFAGQQIERTVPLDPFMLTRFNRIRFEFVGHYTDICEDLSHTSLWLDISQKTNVRLEQKMLPLANDLAFFPEPFFDAGDMAPQSIPFVFAQSPNSKQLQAAGILSSYLGTQAKWRTVEHPVLFNDLPRNHAIVFASNQHRPDFLNDYPEIDAPTVELMALPDEPHYKLLLVMGRDDDDLLTAASALAIGSPVFRGRSVTIDKLQEVAPRKPYDAPNWTPTDRTVLFSELTSHPGQLEVSGLRPRPINLDVNLPPDLFVWRNSGIPLHMLYHYVIPNNVGESTLVLSLNNQLVDGFTLRSNKETGTVKNIRVPLLADDAPRARSKHFIPALRIGQRNQIRFDFSFASIVGSSQRDMCQTLLPPDVRAAIDPNSTIDFSGFHHFLEMPNLRAFAGSAFPFSRMADLSETVVVVPEQPTAVQAATFLEAIGDMGAQIGYPALKMRVVNNWEDASQIDADILLLGQLPDAMKARPDANLLLQDTRTVLRQSHTTLDQSRKNTNRPERSSESHQALSEVSVRAVAPMAAIVGLQSSQYPQRSIVGLLASSDADYALLRDALASSGKRDAMEGSVVIIRESGVYGELVGPTYYVGSLPWWERTWYYLADHPFWLAGLAFVLVLFIAVLLWNVLRLIARKRLERNV